MPTPQSHVLERRPFPTHSAENAKIKAAPTTRFKHMIPLQTQLPPATSPVTVLTPDSHR